MKSKIHLNRRKNIYDRIVSLFFFEGIINGLGGKEAGAPGQQVPLAGAHRKRPGADAPHPPAPACLPTQPNSAESRAGQAEQAYHHHHSLCTHA
jgi:hypothetical protein